MTPQKQQEKMLEDLAAHGDIDRATVGKSALIAWRERLNMNTQDFQNRLVTLRRNMIIEATPDLVRLTNGLAKSRGQLASIAAPEPEPEVQGQSDLFDEIAKLPVVERVALLAEVSADIADELDAHFEKLREVLI